MICFGQGDAAGVGLSGGPHPCSQLIRILAGGAWALSTMGRFILDGVPTASCWPPAWSRAVLCTWGETCFLAW